MLKLGVTTHVPLNKRQSVYTTSSNWSGTKRLHYQFKLERDRVYTTGSNWSRTKRLHYQFKLEQDKAFTLPVQTGAGQSVYTTSSNWSRTKSLHYQFKLDQVSVTPQTRLFCSVVQWGQETMGNIVCVIRLSNQKASNHRRTVVTLRLSHVSLPCLFPHNIFHTVTAKA